MNLIYAMLIAFSMYSRIPMPKTEWTRERMRYMFCFFPVIGAVIGGLMTLWTHFGRRLAGSGSLYTAVLILIPVLVTGGIHLDGFLDTSDALASFGPREKKLEILKDSHAGAFAVLAGICYFLLDFGAYSEVTEQTMRLLAPGFVLSRALSGLSVVTFRMARGSGLAASFSDAAQKRTVGVTMCVYILACLAIMWYAGGETGLVCFAAALAVFAAYRVMSYRVFGGITGDLAGYFLQNCELAMAVAAVVAERLL